MGVTGSGVIMSVVRGSCTNGICSMGMRCCCCAYVSGGMSVGCVRLAGLHGGNIAFDGIQIIGQASVSVLVTVDLISGSFGGEGRIVRLVVPSF